MLTRRHFLQQSALTGTSFYLPFQKILLDNADGV